MRIALITPYYAPSVRGNAITVQRLERGLREHGLTVAVFSLDQRDAEEILRALSAFGPDVVHGFHARHAGPLTIRVGAQLGIPTAITLTGTDVNLDLLDAEQGEGVRDVLRRADAVVAFHQSIVRRAVRAVPAAALRAHVIPQGVDCRDGLTGPGALSPPTGAFLVVQAAGIRPVKNIPSVVEPLAAVHRRHPRLQFVLAGPSIEAEEHARVMALLRGRPWARYLGPLPHGEVCRLLSRAEVLVSSSLAEGGMPNSVLEAMSLGVVVLASDIEGHRSVIEDGKTGLLYRSAGEFEERLLGLLADPRWRTALGAAARERAARDFSRAREADAHRDLYRSLVGAPV